MNKYIIVLPVFLVGVLTGKVLFGGASSPPNAEDVIAETSVTLDEQAAESDEESPSGLTSRKGPVSKSDSQSASRDVHEENSENAWQRSGEPQAKENQSLTKEACFDILVPSDISEFRIAMHQRVDRYLSTNDELWTSGSKEATKPLDFSTLERSLGDYEYQFSVDSSLIHGEGKIGLQVTSHTGKVTGDYELKNYLRGENGDSHVTSSSNGTIGDGNVGTNPERSETFFVWLTPGFSHPQHQDDPARKLVQYGIKIPSGMTPGSTKTLDLYGLHETLKWNRVGRVQLKRVAQGSIN